MRNALHGSTFLLFMADPRISGGGPRRYLAHGEMLAASGYRVYLLANSALGYKSAGMRVMHITGQRSRPLCSWAIHFRRAVARARQAIEALSVDYMLIYGSNNMLAAGLLRRISGAPLIFDPRQNDRDVLRSEAMTLGDDRQGDEARGGDRQGDEARGGDRQGDAARGGDTRKESGDRIRWRGILSWRGIVSWWSHAQRYMVYICRMGITRYGEKYMARMCDFFLFQNMHDAEQYGRRIGFRADRYAVLPNSARVPWLLPADRAIHRSSSARRILYCGALNRQKGAMVLLIACHQLCMARADIALTIVGSGPEEGRIAAYIEQHALGAHITLGGWVDDIVPVMRDHDILVVPSMSEALPDVILEALHIGLPVIGSDIPGIRAALAHDALLFQKQSVEALRLRLLALIEHPAAYRHARALCEERYAHFDFDWVAQFRKIIQVYETDNA